MPRINSPKTGGPTDRMSGVDEYKKTFPQGWLNFNNDKLLKSKEKKAFINHLKNFKGGDIRGHVKIFFRNSSYQLLGPLVKMKTNEVVGRVENKSLFDNRIVEMYKAHRKKTAPSPKSVAALSAHLVPASPAKLKYLQTYLGTMLLSKHNMWSFRNNKDHQKPFNNGIVLTFMPCVLGLNSVAPPFYLLEYKLHSDANRPTVFDAAFFQEWRPGGRSYPLPSCRKRYRTGLPEIIHKPVQVMDFVKPLEEIT